MMTSWASRTSLHRNIQNTILRVEHWLICTMYNVLVHPSGAPRQADLCLTCLFTTMVVVSVISLCVSQQTIKLCRPLVFFNIAVSMFYGISKCTLDNWIWVTLCFVIVKKEYVLTFARLCDWGCPLVGQQRSWLTFSGLKPSDWPPDWSLAAGFPPVSWCRSNSRTRKESANHNFVVINHNSFKKPTSMSSFHLRCQDVLCHFVVGRQVRQQSQTLNFGWRVSWPDK